MISIWGLQLFSIYEEGEEVSEALVEAIAEMVGY